MNSLKLVITFCATIFITTGVMAHTNNDLSTEIPIDSSLVEKTKVSPAQTASLFNFISLPKTRKDTTSKKDDRTSLLFIEIIQSYL